MNVRFTPRAARDLTAIAEYLTAQSPGGAVRVRSAIFSVLQRVADHPASGRVQSVEGVRKVVTPRYPYLVYYTVDEGSEDVVVLSIQHASQQQDYSDR